MNKFVQPRITVFFFDNENVTAGGDTMDWLSKIAPYENKVQKSYDVIYDHIQQTIETLRFID